MRTSTIRLRQAVAMLSAAALLASLTVATVAAPASAAKPRCAGKTATIVGTGKGEVIRGTQKADVIVAKGGNDIVYGRGGNDTICGGPGHDRIVAAGGNDLLLGEVGRDRLYGGPGRDRLLGGPANDRLAGGPGNDACLQGPGTGLRLSCERPLPPVVAPPPPPTLVVAYADANKNHAYDAGDVLIAEIVDTNGTGSVDPGDTINMGQYPTTPLAVAPAAIRQTMEDWPVRSHPVTSADLNADPDVMVVYGGAATRVFLWTRISAAQAYDYFQEIDSVSGGVSFFGDNKNAGDDLDVVNPRLGSPSLPVEGFQLAGDSQGDDGFVDVEIYAP